MAATRRVLVGSLAIALFVTGCGDGRVRLRRGPLGPASYTLELGVAGGPAVGERERARLRVFPRPAGASLRIQLGDERPIVVDLVRTPSGQLALDTVEGVSPTSAGEADLAAVVTQLDPPLPSGRVRLGSRWTRSRRIVTDALDARLTSRLRVTRFRRVGGADALEMQGTIAGRLRATGQTGTFDGDVTGTTLIAWALQSGRLASSDTRLEWDIPGAGKVVVRTVVSPA